MTDKTKQNESRKPKQLGPVELNQLRALIKLGPKIKECLLSEGDGHTRGDISSDYITTPKGRTVHLGRFVDAYFDYAYPATVMDESIEPDMIIGQDDEDEKAAS